MSKGLQTSVEVQTAVEHLVLLGHGKAAIYRELERRGLVDAHGFPSKSTIDRLVDKFKVKDPTGPWTFANDTDPEEAALVLPVLEWVFARTHGRVWLTKGLAKQVARVRAASPTIPHRWAYFFARRYHALAADEDGRHLDLLLAASPPDWTVEGRVTRAIDVWNSRFGPMPRILLPGFLEEFDDPDDLSAEILTADILDEAEGYEGLSEGVIADADTQFDTLADGHP